jgi:hypothetical protein
MKAEAPSKHPYIAKLDGRNAVLAWKLPGVMTVAMRKKTPILPLIVELVTWYMMVWHKAQIKARP